MLQANPSDAVLNSLLDPEGRAFYLKIEESEDAITVRPTGIPVWFLLLCLSLPIGGLVAVAAVKWLHNELDSMLIAMMTIAPPAGIACFALVAFMNRTMLAKGDYFVLDKRRNALTLPRIGVTLRADEIAGFVVVSGWDTMGDIRAGERAWTHELTVLARKDADHLARYPVVISDHGKKIRQLAQNLAGFFHADLRTIRSRML
jgi:hypothetical protein